MRPQVACGLRLFRRALLVAVTAGLAGCAHSNSDMSESSLAAAGAVPRAAPVHSAKGPTARTRTAQSNTGRPAAGPPGDVTATIKPAPLSASIPLPDEALLKRQPPPECELRTQPAGLSPTDVKVATYDYERQCYRQVEAITRGRLDALQDAVGETIKAVKAQQGRGAGN